MSLEDRINTYYNQLTQTDKEIFRIIMEFDFKKTFPTVQDIANKAHVSTTSVHRAIKKIGYKAFTHFKYDIKNLNIPLQIQENYDAMMTHAIEKTLKDYSSIDHTVLYEKLSQARNIYIYGTGNEQQSALQTFSNHFIYYGKPLINIQTLTDLDIYSRKMNREDILIICSLNGNTDNYQHILNTIEMKKTFTVSITASSSNALSQFSNHNLYFYPDFHTSVTNLHWPSITLRVLLDKLINDFFEKQSHI